MANGDEFYKNDTRSSAELLAAYRSAIEAGDDYPEMLAVLHHRGGAEEFAEGRKLAAEESPALRQAGAVLLGQLGWGRCHYRDESVDILLGLLAAPEPGVIAAAASALGHRAHPRAVHALAALTAHPDADVRFSVACALGHHLDDDGAEAVAAGALIILCRDPDRDVRNWAMFGLAHMVSQNTPAIRAVLSEGTGEEDHEIRGEALVGLALRKVPGTAALIRREWTGDFIPVLSLEAAEELADPELLPDLLRLQSEVEAYKDEFWRHHLNSAIAACSGTV